MRKFFHRKTNHWDAPSQILVVDKRQELLRHLERQKRCYTKLNNDFWFGGGKQQVAVSVPRLTASILPTEEATQQHTAPEEETQQQEELERMTVDILKKKLQEITGKPVRLRKREKIIAKILEEQDPNSAKKTRVD